jgi:CRP/FNR family transcriptional regulator
MIDDAQFARVASAFPFVQDAGDDLVRSFREESFIARVPAGKDVFVEGDRVGAIPLLVSGQVRVYQMGESGREITLYRFGPGQSCVLTANAILSQQTFPAIATVQEDAEAVMVPAETFREWVRTHDFWRDFFFELVSQRLASVMAVVDEVAFRRMDGRVAAVLLTRSEAQNPVVVTHQEIASELGSSREVISRILEDFSGRGWIRTGRGQVEVVDRGALEGRLGG